MANYKESTDQVTKFQRAKIATFRNVIGFDKQVSFTEEQCVVMSDGTAISNEIGQVSEVFNSTNASEKFEIIDAVTNKPTGKKASYQDVYNLVSSLYLHVAKKRDEAITNATANDLTPEA